MFLLNQRTHSSVSLHMLKHMHMHGTCKSTCTCTVTKYNHLSQDTGVVWVPYPKMLSLAKVQGTKREDQEVTFDTKLSTRMSLIMRMRLNEI